MGLLSTLVVTSVSLGKAHTAGLLSMLVVTSVSLGKAYTAGLLSMLVVSSVSLGKAYTNGPPLYAGGDKCIVREGPYSGPPL